MSLNRLLMMKSLLGGGSGGGGGVVICDIETPSKDTTIQCLNNLRISFPHATSIDSYAFTLCGKLESVDLPNAVYINEGAFYGCDGLTSVNLPVAKEICGKTFSDCYELVNVNAPNAEDIFDNAFLLCRSLQRIDLPKARDVGLDAFKYCTALDTIILRNTETICNLKVTAILGTKIVTAEGMPTGEGFVYVPAVFYEDYVANLTEQATALTGDAGTAEYIVRAILRKIEDYPEICG